MTDETMDLWPEHFDPLPDEDLPVSILRRQATLLGQKTGGQVEAEVRTVPAPTGTRISFSPHRLADEPEPEPAQFAHQFLLRVRVPSFEDYRYRLFTLYQQPVDQYPLRIDFKDLITEVKSQDDLVGVLRMIFADETTTKIIRTLIAQSQSAVIER